MFVSAIGGDRGSSLGCTAIIEMTDCFQHHTYLRENKDLIYPAKSISCIGITYKTPLQSSNFFFGGGIFKHPSTYHIMHIPNLLSTHFIIFSLAYNQPKMKPRS